MKIFLYIVLAVALLMFYQKEPMISVIIVLLFIALYIFSKHRKNKKRQLFNTNFLMKGMKYNDLSPATDLMLLASLQQLNNYNNSRNTFELDYNRDLEDNEKNIEQIKQEVIELLES